MLGCPWESIVELLLLLFVAMYLLMHGNLPGEDNEESFVCGSEDL